MVDHLLATTEKLKSVSEAKVLKVKFHALLVYKLIINNYYGARGA